MKREIYDKMVYSFKPEILDATKHLKGEKAETKPLYQRVPEVVKSKHDYIQMKRIEYEENNGCSFRPEINQKVFHISLIEKIKL